MKWMPLVALVAAVSLPLGAVVLAQTSSEIERGRAFAEKNCSTCHAIGQTGSSPYAPAPPFRTLHERYDVEALAEALAEGMIVGDTGSRQMPMFQLEPTQIDDLLAYLKSLEIPTSLGEGQDRS
jgi:cytochrome c